MKSPVTRRRLRAGPAADHVDGFADWLHRCGYAPTTIDWMLRCLAGWTDWLLASGFSAQELFPGFEACKVALQEKRRVSYSRGGKRLGIRPSQLCIEQIDAALILAFLAHIEEQRGNAAATRNGRLAAIKAFFRYVEFGVPSALAQARQIHAIPAKRHDQALIRHLTIDEVRAVIDAPDVTTRLGIRDRAMLHLCFAGGLRVSELVGLPLENLSLQRTPSIRVLGKGRKERCLPLWKATTADLRAWLAVRGRVPVPELFVNAQGDAMTRAGFEYVLDKHARTAAKTCASLNGRSVSPHQLRHGCAITMLQATRDIRKVALWLGHADIRTTEIYLRVDPSEKLEAMEAVLPLGLRRGRFKAPDALIASLFEPE